MSSEESLEPTTTIATEELLRLRTEELISKTVELKLSNDSLLSSNEALKSKTEELKKSDNALLVSNQGFASVNKQLAETNTRFAETNVKFAEVNEEILTLNKKLVLANEKIKANGKMQTDFINIAAHELRTPTQSILGYSELLYELLSSSEEGQKDSQKIESAAALFKNANSCRGYQMPLTITRKHGSSLLLLPSISSNIYPPKDTIQHHLSFPSYDCNSNNSIFDSDYYDVKNQKTIGTGKEKNTATKVKKTTSSSPRILIVNDNVDIARLFKSSLERSGFVVDDFSDPVIALSIYKAGVCDLLLLDIRMPKMNGFEFYREIKNRDERLKVCFITAYEEYRLEFAKLFPNSEVDCFIKKPIELRTLAKIVKSKLIAT
jgi:CheY-like chemotaxis protein